jgi:hypothetical protein
LEYTPSRSGFTPLNRQTGASETPLPRTQILFGENFFYMSKQRFIILFVIAALTVLGNTAIFAKKTEDRKLVSFKVRVENIADATGVTGQDGSKYPFALSPGFFIVSNKNSQIFENGRSAGSELEAQAEDGNPSVFLKKYLTRVGSLYAGVFNKPLGSDKAAPIFAGQAFEFTVYAASDMKLNLAFMYGQSNDLFYAPDEAIDLFDSNGNPVSSDITDKIKLWDAGTEVNQAPGLGSDQGPRQKAPNTGADENGVVRLVNDGFTYPETKSVLRVTIEAE